MAISNRRASSCPLTCAKASLVLYTCRPVMASKALCAASPNSSGGCAYVTTSPLTYVIVMFVNEKGTLTEIPAPPSDACPPTNHLRRCTSTSSAVKSWFPSALLPSRFSRWSTGSRAGKRQSPLTTSAPRMLPPSSFRNWSLATALPSRYTPIAAPNSNLFYLKSCARYSASTRQERHLTDINQTENVSVSIRRSSICCVEQFSVAFITGSHYCQLFFMRTGKRLLNPLT